METDSGKLLPVVLAGQPELADRLNEPSLRQLKQRIALRCDLRPLDLRETAAYIAARLRSAGGDGRDVFTREAVVAIHEQSRGIPRTISVIGDNALINGFAVGRRPVGHDLVMEACRDLDFNHGPAPALADPITDAPERVTVPTAIPARPGTRRVFGRHRSCPRSSVKSTSAGVSHFSNHEHDSREAVEE